MPTNKVGKKDPWHDIIQSILWQNKNFEHDHLWHKTLLRENEES